MYQKLYHDYKLECVVCMCVAGSGILLMIQLVFTVGSSKAAGGLGLRVRKFQLTFFLNKYN